MVKRIKCQRTVFHLNPRKVGIGMSPHASLGLSFQSQFSNFFLQLVDFHLNHFRFRRQMFESLNLLIKWFKEHFRDTIPNTPGSRGGTSRTPYGSGTPGGITPGAMSVAGGGTPGQRRGLEGRSVNAPYTPTANTPFMTPYHTPGTICCWTANR